MIIEFFELLSEKYYKENDLSNIVWILCSTSLNFRAVFLKFIFGDIFDRIELINIEREFISENNNSRVDFKFESQNKTYLIENKIYDRNYHYDEYLKNYPNCEIGFISNYRVNEKIFYKYIRTWEDFYHHLETQIEIIDDDIEKKVLAGFLNFLKGVCSIMNVKNFSLNKISSLETFHSLIEKIINSHEDGLCELYGKAKGIEKYRSGTYFTLINGKKETYYLWFGIYTADWCQYLYIGIRRDWNEKLYQKLISANIQEGEYYNKPYDEDDSWFWFEIKSDYLEKLNNDSIIFQDKYAIMNCFFNEIITCCLNSVK